MENSKRTVKSKQHQLNTKVEEPESAHATPIVENYIKNRNKKAEKQIKHEGSH